jgi:hypothetical protein
MDAIRMLRIISEGILTIEGYCVRASETVINTLPCKLDQINADPKGNWYRLELKGIYQQTSLRSEC